MVACSSSRDEPELKMPIEFKIEERLAGYAAAPGKGGESVPIIYRELIGPLDALHLQQQLDQLHGTLFSKIPSLPDPSTIHHLLVLIRPDLSCIAYVNELNIRDKVKVNRSVKRGEPIFAKDIADVAEVDLNVDIPPDFGVVFVRSLGWKRALFFRFRATASRYRPQDYSNRENIRPTVAATPWYSRSSRKP